METLAINASVENSVENGLIQSVLETTPLNWSVSKQPIQTVSGLSIPNKVAIVRNDNNAVLGIFTDNYEPYQNEIMLELLYKISKQSGLAIHKSGLFGQGEKTYIQLKSEEFSLPNDDKIKTYFTAVNSFDGSTQFGFGTSSITISCMNTFMGAYKTLESKMKHTLSMHIKLDGIIKQLDLMRLEEQENFKTIEKMGNVKIDEATRLLVTKMLFDIPLQEKFSFNELIENPNKKISTRKQNQIIAFQNDLLTETAQKGDNLWGMFSGMTRFTTHSLNRDTTENKMFGSLGDRERKVFNTLAEMVG